MPIRIINSGVNLTPEPNTCSTVVFRSEAGIVSRTSASYHGRRKRSSQYMRRSSLDASGAAGFGSDRPPMSLGAEHFGGDGGEGGVASSPHDMTSVFGLQVHRLTAEELAAEEKNRRDSKRSALQAPTKPGTDRNASTLGTPETEIELEGTASPEEWLRRARGGNRKPYPACMALTERVREGNSLVKSVRAGRSLRQATRSSAKGALELGLWAVSRPSECVDINMFRNETIGDKPSTPKDASSPGLVAGGPTKQRVSAEVSGDSDDSDGIGGGLGEGNLRGNDRVKALEGKLRAMDEQRERRVRITSISRQEVRGGTEATRGRITSNSSRSGASARTATTPPTVSSNRGGGSTPPTGAPRVAGQARPNDGRGSKPRVSSGGGTAFGPGAGSEAGVAAAPAASSSSKVEGSSHAQDHYPSGSKRMLQVVPKIMPLHVRDVVVRAVPGIVKAGPPPEASLSSRSAPATTGGGRVSRPHGTTLTSGSLSARRAPPRAPMVISEAVKKELKAAVKAYVLRHASLDNALLDTIRRRHFDWDTDMRRMMDAVKVSAAGEGRRTFESVPNVMRRQVLAKKRLDEANSMRGSWFPSLMKRMFIVVRDKGKGGMPPCMTRLAAALYKVLVSGYMVTPDLFWSFVSASFKPEDHRDRAVQKMVLACLKFVRQRPEDYYNFLVDNSIKVPTSLRRGLTKANQKRPHKKGTGKKSQMGNGSTRMTASEADRRGEWTGAVLSAGNVEARRDGGGSRWASTSTRNGSDDSDDASDTMSVFSCMSRETIAVNFPKELPVVFAGRGAGGADLWQRVREGGVGRRGK